MYQILMTPVFKRWLKKLKNPQARKAVALRLARVEAGNLGDAKSLGQGLYELRLFIGAGYRLYFTMQDERLIILLCAGDKSSQSKDIASARMLKMEIDHET